MSLTVQDVQQAKRREDLVPGYAAAIVENQNGGTIDFAAINRAIVARWSPNARDYIKAKAWKAAGF